MKKSISIIAVVAIILIAAGGYYGLTYFPFNKKAKQVDQEFSSLKGSYQNVKQKGFSSSASIDEIKSFLNASKDSYKTANSLKTKIDKINAEKNFITRRSPYPKTVDNDILRFIENINSDISNLPQKIEAVYSKERKKFNTDIVLSSTNTVKSANNMVKNFNNLLEKSKSLTLVLKPFDSTDNRKAFSNLNRMFKNDSFQSKEILKILDQIVEKQKNTRQALKTAFERIDSANSRLQTLEKYARSQDIYRAYQSWDSVCDQVGTAHRICNSLSGFTSSRDRTIAKNMMANDNSNISRTLSKAEAHRDYLYQEYGKAAQQESTVGGSLGRSAQRGLNRLKNFVSKQVDKASQSRMGREIGVSIKTLILGSKMFYDFMGMGPNDDYLSWAMSYEKDMDQLMNEVDEVNRMDEASITGKNTFIEDLVNKAYEKSFEKK